VEYKKIKIPLKIFIFLSLIFNFYQCKNVLSSTEPIIKVLIKKDNYVRIRSDNSFPIRLSAKDFSRRKVQGITIRKKDKKNTIFFDSNKEKIYNIGNKTKLILRTSDKRGIWVGGKRYQGLVKVYFSNDGIFIINELGIEKYLNSVVGGEMPYKWPMEALRAQAIASRTYAIKKMNNSLYDIDSTQNDQVYNGLESNTYETSRAVKSTRSLVLVHNDKLINAVFHSSSGGITENSHDVWENKLPYLKSVRDFDQNNPKLRWERGYTENKLEDLFPTIGGIKKIDILNISQTGRIKQMKISGKYDSKEISGKEFRSKLKLKSTLFRFKYLYNIDNEINDNIQSNISSGDYILFSGLGAGHGVGMSQWGAKYMAERGFKANQILKHFYSGVQIKPFKKYYK